MRRRAVGAAQAPPSSRPPASVILLSGLCASGCAFIVGEKACSEMRLAMENGTIALQGGRAGSGVPAKAALDNLLDTPTPSS